VIRNQKSGARIQEFGKWKMSSPFCDSWLLVPANQAPMSLQLRVSAPVGTFLIALFSLCSGSLFAQQPAVRSTGPEKEEIWVGQRAKIVIELLVPGFFSGAPAFDLPAVADILLIPPEERPILSSEAIQGVSYTVQRYELLVFARRAGQHEIPPFAIRLKYKRAPLDKESLKASVLTPPVQFLVLAPPGAENLAGILSSDAVTCTDKWQPESTKAKVGEAFTRTVTFSASNIPAMVFPPFPISEIDGIGTYGKPPVLNDRSERGVMRGERRDTITYICQRPGRFVIPAVQLTWWDLKKRQLQTIVVPPRVLEVAPNPALSTPVVAEADSRSSKLTPARVILSGLAIFVIATIVWRTWPFWRRVLAQFRPTHLVPLNPSDVLR
jgi:hypothetical protein